jgi:hypothetical protein
MLYERIGGKWNDGREERGEKRGEMGDGRREQKMKGGKPPIGCFGICNSTKPPSLCSPSLLSLLPSLLSKRRRNRKKWKK